eukprot:scaffold30415_cov124-Isochrysis_galbana.AAC.8
MPYYYSVRRKPPADPAQPTPTSALLVAVEPLARARATATTAREDRLQPRRPNKHQLVFPARPDHQSCYSLARSLGNHSGLRSTGDLTHVAGIEDGECCSSAQRSPAHAPSWPPQPVRLSSHVRAAHEEHPRWHCRPTPPRWRPPPNSAISGSTCRPLFRSRPPPARGMLAWRWTVAKAGVPSRPAD